MAASPSGDECAEEEEDELEPGLDEAEPEPDSGARAAGGPRGAVLTRRGITLRVLLRDGLLEAGRGVLSIYYLVRAAGTGGVGMWGWGRGWDMDGDTDGDRMMGILLRTRDVDGDMDVGYGLRRGDRDVDGDIEWDTDGDVDEDMVGTW